MSHHKYISHFSIHVAKHSSALTQMEKDIVQYLLKNKNRFTFEDFTIANVSRQLNISTTSLHRLTKKLGYSSFILLKEDYFLNLEEEQDEQMEADNYLSMITSTYQIVNNQIRKEMLKAMHEASRITLYGMGMSRYICEIFQIKLRLLGIPTEQYDDSRFMKLSTQILEAKKDVIIILSRSGSTPELIEVLMDATARNVESILITESRDTVLESLATFVLYTSNAKDTNDDIDTRINTHIAMDLIMKAYNHYIREDLHE